VQSLPATEQAPAKGRPLVSAAVYGLAGASQRALGLLLLPLYTRALSPSQYGDLSVILSVNTAAVILLAFGQDAALFRTYFKLEDDKPAQANFVSSAWTLLICTSGVGVLLLTLIAWPILAGSRISLGDMALGLCSAGMIVISTTVPLTVLRAEQRLKAFMTLTVFSAVATTSLTVIYVVVLDTGVTGWLVAALAANAMTAVVAMLIVPFHLPRPFDRLRVRGALKLGVPLMPHFISHWALQLADRAVLTGLVSAAAVGVYSLTSNLALPALIAVQSLNQGFMPMYARAAHRTEQRGGLPAVATTQLLISAALCLACALVLPPLVTVIAPASYTGAATLIPWLVLGYAFVAAYFLPMNGLSLVLGKTTFVWVSTAFAAALNITLILVFTPHYGLKAAAIASAVGYFALLVGTTLYARWHKSPVTIQPVRGGLGLLALGAAYPAIALTTPETGVRGFAIRLAVLAGAAVVGALVLRARRGRGTPAAPAVSGDGG
jgi:O-antigen/teichoic acid export membrane protein